MLQNSTLGTFFSVAMMTLATNASAQDLEAYTYNCAPRELITENLYESFGETQTAVMLNDGSHSLTEIFSNEISGTWSALVTTSSGISCLTSHGSNHIDLSQIEHNHHEPLEDNAPLSIPFSFILTGCMNHSSWETYLSQKSDQSRQLIMATTDDLSTIFAVYTNQNTGEWTMLSSNLNGQSCFVSQGSAFENIDNRFDLHPRA